MATKNRKLSSAKDAPNILKAVDVKVNDAPVEDPGLLAALLSSMAAYFRHKEWQEECTEENSEYVEEQMFGTYSECPACGCEMNDGDSVCPQCGCDTSKIDPEEDEADSQEDMVQMSAYFIEKSANDELRQGTYVVLEPDEEDLHGDTYSEEEVRKACHNFNTSLEKARLDHQVETEEMSFVESYIAPADIKIGEEMVKKGTWMAVVQYSPELWQDVKSGKYTGLSIGAYADVENL